MTRRLYRSGDSEYLIDGQICRLRDVHDLLMDTGLGAKAYAIIEQGKIGLILSSRPTDRRQLIEEAAGVTKYKSRRRSAELKLEAAQLNLTRIDDIVFEVEKQRGTLKRQAGRARRYQKLRDRLRRLGKGAVRAQVSAAGGGDGIGARTSERRARARGRRRGPRGRDRVRSRARADRAGRSRIAGDAPRVKARTPGSWRSTASSSRSRSTASRLTGSVAAARSWPRSSTRSTRGASLPARRSPPGARRPPPPAQTATRPSRRWRTTPRRTNRRIARSRDSRRTSRRRAARCFPPSTRRPLCVTRSNMRRPPARGWPRRSPNWTSKSTTCGSDRSAWRPSARRRPSGCAARRTPSRRRASPTPARESELASARIEHEWRARSVRGREQELAGVEARLKSLEELEAARAGYGDAARAVLAQANGKVAQQGAVADYLEVEAGFERAVEACLGDLLQHVVVERPEHAARGISTGA